MPVTHAELDAAAEQIRAGALVAFPTETVYGLGANATDAAAVAKIFEAKARPKFDPLIVHLSSSEALTSVASYVPKVASRLAEQYWPGPLTLVLPKNELIPDLVTAGLPTVGVRVPDHHVARSLIHRSGVPIAAPSANRFAAVSPTSAEHVREQFGDDAFTILDGGPCRVGLESTIIGFEGDAPVLLRPGGISLEDVQTLIGAVRIPDPATLRDHAPGRSRKHYSTMTPLRFEGEPLADHLRAGYLGLSMPANPARYESIEVLAPDGSLTTAAAALFAAMRRLDAQGLDVIVAAPVPESGLGRAIMDRLKRAAQRD